MAHESQAGGGAGRKLTVLCWLAADTGVVTGNLRAAMQQDYREIVEAGATPEMGVCVAYDLGDGPDQWRVVGEDHAAGGNGNMASLTNLLAFIDWSVERCPAEQYALVVGGHGSGPARDTETYRGVRPNHIADTSKMAPDSVELGRVGQLIDLAYDDGSRASMSIADLGVACRHIASIGPLACAALDSCLMASIEVAEELMGAAATLVASPEPIPASGFEYTRLLRHWQSTASHWDPCDPTWPRFLAEQAVIAFEYAHDFERKDEHDSEYEPPRTRILALDLTRMPELLDAMDAVAGDIMDWVSKNELPPLSDYQRTAERRMAYLSSWLLELPPVEEWLDEKAAAALRLLGRDGVVIAEWSADGEGHGPSAFIPESGPVEGWYSDCAISKRPWGKMVKWAVGG